MITPLARLLAELSGNPVGQSWKRGVSHPYFEELTFCCVSDLEGWYWEAKLPVPGSGERVHVSIDDTPEGPGPEHEAFCRSVLADPDHLFGICRPVFEPEFTAWADKPWPEDWRTEFKLSYLAPPVDCVKDGEWQVSYFVPSAGVSFTAFIRRGKANSVLVGE